MPSVLCVSVISFPYLRVCSAAQLDDVSAAADRLGDFYAESSAALDTRGAASMMEVWADPGRHLNHRSTPCIL